MKRARFTEEQIIGVLREHEAGAKTADLARKHGVSEATLYNWKAKYGGMDVSEAKRLKQLEERECEAEEAAGRGDAGRSRAARAPVKKMVGPAAKREGVAHLQALMGLSERRACSIVGADRKMIRYRSRRPADTALRARLRDLANERRRFGYRRLFVLLRQEGERSGMNRIYRLYREEGLTVRKRRARRRAVGTRAPILGRGGRQCPLVPGFRPRPVRQRAAVSCPEHRRRRDAGMSGGDPRHFDLGPARGAGTGGLIERRGKPGMIVSDNGTEFTSNAMFAWTQDNAIVWHFIAPGKPMQNGFCESFNGRMRDELLNETPILRSRPRADKDSRLGRRLQSAAPALGAWLHDAGRLCGHTHRNKRSAAQPRPYLDSPLASAF